MNWNRTKVTPAPSDVEVLLSDGTTCYLGTYSADLDRFFDQNRFLLPTPLYWMPLPPPPAQKTVKTDKTYLPNLSRSFEAMGEKG